MALRGHNSMTDIDRIRARRVYRLAKLLDSKFRIPGTNIRFGLDGLLGLIPGVGDTVTALMAGYIILEAFRLGVSRGTIVRMLGNVVIDWVVGAIPVIGDLFDVVFQANMRNLRLMERDLAVSFSDL